MRKRRLSALVVICAVAAAFSPASASVQDDVTGATTAALYEKLGIPKSLVRVSYVSVVGRWAFTTWSAQESAGDSIIHKVDGKWDVLDQGHGEMNHVILVASGVPPAIADALLHGACPTQSGELPRSGVEYTTVAVRRSDRRRGYRDRTIPCPAFVTAESTIGGAAPSLFLRRAQEQRT
jgi:hypothetical protein